MYFFVSGESWLPAIDDAGSSLGIIIFTPDDDQDGTCPKIVEEVEQCTHDGLTHGKDSVEYKYTKIGLNINIQR